MSEAIKKISDASFSEQVLNAAGPVLVDYWAEWCGPCRMIAPLLDDAAKDYGNRITIAKVNVDENPKTPRDYHVRGIPTLMLFKDGQVVATQVGAVNKAQLSAFLDKHL